MHVKNICRIWKHTHSTSTPPGVSALASRTINAILGVPSKLGVLVFPSIANNFFAGVLVGAENSIKSRISPSVCTGSGSANDGSDKTLTLTRPMCSLNVTPDKSSSSSEPFGDAGGSVEACEIIDRLDVESGAAGRPSAFSPSLTGAGEGTSTSLSEGSGVGTSCGVRTLARRPVEMSTGEADVYLAATDTGEASFPRS